MERISLDILSHWIPGLLLRLLQVSAAVLLGFILHRIFFESGLAGEIAQMLAGTARSIYNRIGIVSVGLA